MESNISLVDPAFQEVKRRTITVAVFFVLSFLLTFLSGYFSGGENITYRKLFYNLGGYAWGIGVLLSLAGVFIILGKIVKKYPDRKYTPKLLGLFLACSLLTGLISFFFLYMYGIGLN